MISKIGVKSSSIVNAVAKLFVLAGIHPMAVSLIAIPFALVSGFFTFHSSFLPAFFFGLLAVLMDLLDGPVARQSGKCSLFGNYIEGTIDKSVDFILIGSFVFLFPFATVLALGCSFLVSFAKPRVALVIITDNRNWPGIGERGDKMVLLLSGMFLASFYPMLFGFETMKFALLLVAIVSIAGLFQRLSYGQKLIKEAKQCGTVLPYLNGGKNCPIKQGK